MCPAQRARGRAPSQRWGEKRGGEESGSSTRPLLLTPPRAARHVVHRLVPDAVSTLEPLLRPPRVVAAPSDFLLLLISLPVLSSPSPSADLRNACDTVRQQPLVALCLEGDEQALLVVGASSPPSLPSPDASAPRSARLADHVLHHDRPASAPGASCGSASPPPRSSSASTSRTRRSSR